MTNFVWNYDQTEATRTSTIKSIYLHDSEGGGDLRWVVYGVDYDDNLITLCFVRTEDDARIFAESLIDAIDKSEQRG